MNSRLSTAKPSASQIAKRNGRRLCVAMPESASSTMRAAENLLSPLWRVPRWYGIVVSGKPSQRTSPRRKMSWSSIPLTMSTTARSSSM